MGKEARARSLSTHDSENRHATAVCFTKASLPLLRRAGFVGKLKALLAKLIIALHFLSLASSISATPSYKEGMNFAALLPRNMHPEVVESRTVECGIRLTIYMIRVQVLMTNNTTLAAEFFPEFANGTSKLVDGIMFSPASIYTSSAVQLLCTSDERVSLTQPRDGPRSSTCLVDITLHLLVGPEKMSPTLLVGAENPREDGSIPAQRIHLYAAEGQVQGQEHGRLLRRHCIAAGEAGQDRAAQTRPRTR